MLVRKGRLSFSVVEDSGNETKWVVMPELLRRAQSLRHEEDFSFPRAIEKEVITINMS